MRKLKSMPTYREYAEYIDRFVELVSLPKRVLSERDRDLRHTWIGNADFIL